MCASNGDKKLAMEIAKTTDMSVFGNVAMLLQQRRDVAWHASKMLRHDDQQAAYEHVEVLNDHLRKLLGL